ncbi:hypothetical protein ACS0PU_010641 [Formica fusca]
MQLAVAAAARDHFSPSGVILYRLCHKFVQARRLIRFGDWRKDVARSRLRANRFPPSFARRLVDRKYDCHDASLRSSMALFCLDEVASEKCPDICVVMSVF